MSTNCPTFSCPLAPPEAVNIIRILERVERSTEMIPASLARITELEAINREKKGWNLSRKSTMAMLALFVGFALTIWGTVQKTNNLQASVAAAHGEALDASDLAIAVQNRLDIANQKAEAAAIKHANLAATAQENSAKIRAMRSAVAQNSVNIAAIPPTALPPPPAKKKWRILP